MKFTLVMKRCKETEDYFKRYSGKAFGDGSSLLRLDAVDLVDTLTGGFYKPAYALRCKSSILDYLRFKKWWASCPIIPGWKK